MPSQHPLHPDPRSKGHTEFGVYGTIKGEDLAAQRHLHKGSWGKKQPCYSHLKHCTHKPRSCVEHSVPKAMGWLPTLLLSPLLLPAQLKLVAEVGNPAPLASTDKACELLK